MMNFETYSCTPCNEPCQQVGMPDYDGQKAVAECKAFIHQLRRQFGEEPAGAQLRIKTFPHDFGSYLEVCIIFDEEVEEQVNYAYGIEGALPEDWDDEAKKELGL